MIEQAFRKELYVVATSLNLWAPSEYHVHNAIPSKPADEIVMEDLCVAWCGALRELPNLSEAAYETIKDGRRVVLRGHSVCCRKDN